MAYSIGKLRRLQQCATPEGKFVILAVDHRDNLQAILQAAHPSTPIGYDEMVAFKLAATAGMQAATSSVLLDPEYGAAQAIEQQALSGQVGLIVSVERWGYTGDALARETAVLPQWGVAQIARMGGSGVKMLLYYHPEAPNVASQNAVVSQVVAACEQHDIPFFLEPIVYSRDRAQPQLPTQAKRPLVIEAARTFSTMGIDILKAEFPVNIADEPDETVWAEACAELSAASRVPWVLLSAGVNFDTFARMTQVACKHGCSGVMVGRAVWQEAIPLTGEARAAFMRDTALNRMQQLATICAQDGRPWSSLISAAQAVKPDWYQTYPGL